MKQDIWCAKCGQNWKPNRFPGEHTKSVPGIALRDYLCDLCATPIPKDTLCFAISMWSDTMAIPYFKWEHEYLEEISKEDLKTHQRVKERFGLNDPKKGGPDDRKTATD